MAFRKFFDSIEPNFEKGGKYEKFYPLFEMVETIFYTSSTVTKAAPHARSTFYGVTTRCGSASRPARLRGQRLNQARPADADIHTCLT